MTPQQRFAAIYKLLSERTNNQVHDYRRLIEATRLAREGMESKQIESVLIMAKQLRNALELIILDDQDSGQEETEVVIEWMPSRTSDEGEHMPEGLYLWFVDCPEEGVSGPL